MPNAEGLLIWDLADPENPKTLGHFKTGGAGTHRNYYDGGRYLYATGLPQGYNGHILQIVDIGDPTSPVEISRWWRKGQWIAGGEEGAPHGTLLHGGAYVRGDRAYLHTVRVASRFSISLINASQNWSAICRFRHRSNRSLRCIPRSP